MTDALMDRRSKSVGCLVGYFRRYSPWKVLGRVFPACQLSLGFAVLGNPVCLTPVLLTQGLVRSALVRLPAAGSSPSYMQRHISFALPCPIRGQSATSLRTV